MAAQDSLKVIGIFGRTDSAGVAVADVDQEELRMSIGVLLSPGYTPNLLDQTANPNSFRVRQDSGANLQLKIGSGTTKLDGYVVRGTVAGQGSYVVRLDAATKTVTVPAADATNPSRYGVYLFINDTAYGGTAGRAFVDINCIRGTPAGSPTTPGPLAAWSASVLLWEFQLPALATAVTNTILDSGTAFDRRTPSTSPIQASSSPRAFTTAALRDAAITAPTEGMLVSVTGEDRLYAYTGAVWARVGNYTAAGRTGFALRRAANQSIPNAVNTSIIWDTEDIDSDGFITVPTNGIVIPAGLGGLYLGSLVVTGASAWGGVSTDTFTINGSQTLTLPGPIGQSAVSWEVMFFVNYNAADTITVNLTHHVGGATNFVATFNLFRVMI